MEFSVRAGSLGKQRTGCIVVGVYEGRELSTSAAELDIASRHVLADALARGDLDGELGSTLFLHNVPKVAAERVLLVGLGPKPEFRESHYCTALSSAIKALRTTGAAEATICLNELPIKGRDVAWKIEHAARSVMEGLYRFDKLKSKPPQPKRVLKKVAFHLADRSGRAAGEAAID